MHRTCIAVVDATRARLFTLDRSDDSGALRETLAERTDLVNPIRRQTPAQIFSDSRPGTSRIGGRQYAFDDHRDAHIDSLDAGFARAITAAIREALDDTGAERLILCASPRMLGALRLLDLGHANVAIDELPRDYVKLTPTQIREVLGKQGLLPAVPVRN